MAGLSDERSAAADALPPERTSGWAIASLICAIGIACPLLALIAPLLGLKAVAHIRSTPGTGGMRLAMSGIALGLVGVIFWISAAIWWNAEGRQRMLNGPQDELRAGLAGDIASFKAGFTEPGASAADAEALRFLNELSTRYGRFERIQQDTFRPDPEPGRLSDVIPYVLHFDRRLVQAEARLVLFADGLQPKWGYIVVLDDERGDFSFPPGEQRLPEPPPAQQDDVD